jgi:hypothetical protein
MGTMTFFVVVALVIYYSNAIKANIKEKKDVELLERNPEAWKKVKELELEKNSRKQAAIGGAAVSVLRILFKK